MKKTILFLLSILAPCVCSAGSWTSRLNLYKPVVGELNWGTIVSSNFVVLDTAVAGVGVTNTFTSTQVFLSSVTIGNPTTPAFMLDMLGVQARAKIIDDGGQVWNVIDGGAKGDGTTNDTPAINAEIAKAGNAGGGVVYFPPGTYSINNSLQISSNNVYLVGAGFNSVIKATSAVTAIIYITTASPNYVYYGGVANLYLDATAGNNAGLYLNNASYTRIENVYIKGGNRGIQLEGNIVSPVFEQAFANNNSYGMRVGIAGAVSVNDVMFHASSFNNNTVNGWLFGTTGLSSQVTCLDCVFDNNTSTAIVTSTGVVDMAIVDSYFEGGPAVLMQNDNHTLIRGGHFDSASKIISSGASYPVIDKAQFDVPPLISIDSSTSYASVDESEYSNVSNFSNASTTTFINFNSTATFVGPVTATKFIGTVDVSSTSARISKNTTSTSWSGCNVDTVTITTNGRPIAIWATGDVANNTSGDGCDISILQDGQFIDDEASNAPMSAGVSAANNAALPFGIYHITRTKPAVGSHSYCMGFYAQTGGTCTVGYITYGNFGAVELQ